MTWVMPLRPGLAMRGYGAPGMSHWFPNRHREYQQEMPVRQGAVDVIYPRWRLNGSVSTGLTARSLAGRGLIETQAH